MLQYNPSISGSLNITGSLIISNGMIGTVNGVDVQIFSSSINQVITGIQAATGSQEGRLGSIESFTSSTSARLNSIETTSASVDTLNTIQNSRLNSLEEKTGSLATTGSNTFYGQQVFSGSLYVQDNLIVQGSSSLQNITASAVSIGTNIVYLNTDTPAVRFAGLTVQDSGSSAGVTGSMLWDSLCNRWVYSNPSTIGYSGGMILSGPRAATLGTETTLTCNYIAKSGGGDHLYDSLIYDDGTNVGINRNNPTRTLDILGASGIGTVLKLEGASGTTTYLQLAYNGATNAQSGYIGYDSSSQMQFFTANTLAATINSSGNVGINAVSPNVKLEVCGTGLFTDNSTYVGGCGGQLRIVKSAASTPATMTIFGYDNLSLNQAAGAIDFDLQLTGTCGQTAASIRALNADDNESSAHLVFYTATNTGVTKAGAASTERLRITCDGRVGIGTCTPGALLAVQARSGTDGFAFFMGGTGTTLGGIKLGNDGNPYGTLYFDNATNDVLLLQQYSIGNLRLGTNSGEKMRITSGGNVVIGNTTPYGGLTVSEFTTNDCNDSISLFYRGTSGNHESLIKFYDFRCQLNASIGNNLHDDTPSGQKARLVFKTSNNGTPTERMRIDACGKVGIGTNSPCSILHIVDTSANATTLTIGENGEVPTIKAGGTNTDLRIEAVGGGGYLEFVTNGTNRFRTVGTGETTFTCQICTPGISITSNPIGVEYLIIAGGGGGGWDVGGGGGAGGVLNGSTGIWPGTYNIGIGAGGAGATTGVPAVPNNGYNTYGIGLTAIGGGGGGNYSGGSGLSGGSGGGGSGYGSTTNAGFGMKGQGFEGGCGINVAGNGSTGGAGGGAGGAGASSINNLYGCLAGGTGIISTIIGEYRSYGCGGRGGGDSWTGNQAGRTNTGDGGDGAGVANGVNNGSNGGSGLAIIKMRNTNTASFSGGLTTYTCTHITGYNIYVVTAGAGTVTIS